jgi:disulfide bond formation protein DsbB
MFLIFVAIIGLSGRKDLKIPYLVILTCAIVLGCYHVAIEKNLIEISALCSSISTAQQFMSIEEFKEMLNYQTIPLCNKPTLLFMDLSMTEYNLIVNILLLLLFVLSQYKNYHAKTLFS